MKNRGKVKELLMQQLEQRWEQFASKYKQMWSGLKQEVDQLKEIYGKDVVNALLVSTDMDGRWSESPLECAMQKVAKHEPDAGAKMAESVEPKRKRRKPKRGRKPKQENKGASFSELEPLVLEAVRSMRDKEFTRKEIEGVLAKKGVEFLSNRVSLVLSKSISGLKQVGKRKRENGGGPPFYVYKAGERMGLKRKK